MKAVLGATGLDNHKYNWLPLAQGIASEILRTENLHGIAGKECIGDLWDKWANKFIHNFDTTLIDTILPGAQPLDWQQVFGLRPEA